MESNRRGEVLSPAITLVDQQLRKLRDSMDKHGSKEYCNDSKDLLSVFIKHSDTYCGKMAMLGRLERFMANVTSKIERRQLRKEEVMKVVEVQIMKLNNGHSSPGIQKDLQTVIADMMQLAEGIGSAQKEYVMLCNIKELIEEMPVAERKSTVPMIVTPPEFECMPQEERKYSGQNDSRKSSKVRSISPARYTSNRNSECGRLMNSPIPKRSSCLNEHNRNVLRDWADNVSSILAGGCARAADAVRRCRNQRPSHHHHHRQEDMDDRFKRKLYNLMRSGLVTLVLTVATWNCLYNLEPFQRMHRGTPVV